VRVRTSFEDIIQDGATGQSRIVLRKDKTSRSYAGFVSLAFALINIKLCH
jgi:hypothetical protein